MTRPDLNLCIDSESYKHTTRCVHYAGAGSEGMGESCYNTSGTEGASAEGPQSASESPTASGCPDASSGAVTTGGGGHDEASPAGSDEADAWGEGAPSSP